MKQHYILRAMALGVFSLVINQTLLAQDAQIRGRITDSSGAIIVGAHVTVLDVDRGVKRTAGSADEGYYSIGLLHQGNYQISVEMQGFKPIKRSGIKLDVHQVARIDFMLEVGEVTERIEVDANASPLNFENAEVKGTITPKSLEALPLIVGGNLRSAASFVTLIPGVTTPGGQPDDARINGGVHFGDEAVVDGISMQDGANGQSGMDLTLYDHPLSPEAMSEVSLLTSNYEPQYGATSSSVVTAVTKSGTNEFHGGLYEYLRNTVLNARQFGVPDRPKDLENDFGGNIGGPVKIPWLFSTPRKKSYFFFNYEGFRIRGGASTPVLSIPSLKERQGDFTDWVDSDGSLIPIYDPATTQPNPAFNASLPPSPTNLPYLRNQFMGCDGKTPNVICPADPRLQNSLAKQWFQFLPNPTFTGPQNNYVVPVPVPLSTNGNGTLVDVRVDQYYGDKDRFFVTVHYHGSSVPPISQLPPELSFDEPYGINYSFLDRFSWDHTFSPKVLNHFAFGYNDIYAVVECLDKPYADQLPQIQGVASHEFPPVINFEDFTTFGCSDGFNGARPAYIANDQLTWVRGAHTFKFGGEYRALQVRTVGRNNNSGTFNFSRLNTGLSGVNSGNAIASFLLEAVDNSSVQFQTVEATYAREKFISGHFGDTWKVTPKLSLNYGIRWDLSTPTVEKYDNLSFLDPSGPNSGAGNHPGSLAFAGTNWGTASFGRRHPELTWYRAFAPRLGIAYSLTPKTVVRAGYGIFYQRSYYPGWNSGMSLEGFNANVSFASSLGGLQPAFVLSQGFPQNFTPPPSIDSAASNGQSSINYRPFDANRLPYGQQWNLTVERQFTNDFYVNAAYVGNKGTRLLSRTVPINALDPTLLSMGQALYDQYQPNQTSLNGVPVPYAGWVEQMTGCAPTLAQALSPYPQYCSGLYGQNENAGNSTYHSFQFKAEKRFSGGIWFLASYTLSKLLTSSDDVQTDSGTYGRVAGGISPFERHRNKALSYSDVPQTLSVAFIYELPFGQGKRFLGGKGGVASKVLGGWKISTLFRASSGVPYLFRSNNCNVPEQFWAECIPAILPGANPLAQNMSSFEPSRPLFNPTAFESADSFNFYYGQGPRVSNLRNFGYHNQDFGLIKDTKINESVTVQFRGEFFNLWNWHTFMCQTFCAGSLAFENDVSSPTFGLWNGNVTNPRNIQLGLKILF